jgi:ABC-type sugar transport system substrate-binding protein
LRLVKEIGRVAMSNNYQGWDDEDFDIEDEQPTQHNVNSGTDLVKQLRKQLKEFEKKNKELEGQVSEYTSKQRQEVIQKVLEERGVNPKVAKLIPSDVDATNVDALNSWLEEYGDAFGIPQSEGSTADVDNLKRINSATQGAAMPDNIDDIDAMIGKAESEEELYNILRNLG